MSSTGPELTNNPAPRGETSARRRDLLGLSALWSFLAAIGAATVGIVRFPKPAVMPGPRQVYRIDSPERLKVGSVTEIGTGSVFLHRDEEGFYAISAICTHLGCRVKRGGPDRLSCPCHGSYFDAQGRVVRGPAPRGLPWLRVSLRANGQLEIDAAEEVPRGSKLRI